MFFVIKVPCRLSHFDKWKTDSSVGLPLLPQDVVPSLGDHICSFNPVHSSWALRPYFFWITSLIQRRYLFFSSFLRCWNSPCMFPSKHVTVWKILTIVWSAVDSTCFLFKIMLLTFDGTVLIEHVDGQKIKSTMVTPYSATWLKWLESDCINATAEQSAFSSHLVTG